MRKLCIEFTDEQQHIIKTLRGFLGETEAEVVKSIFVIWLSEQKVIDEILKEAD